MTGRHELVAATASAAPQADLAVAPNVPVADVADDLSVTQVFDETPTAMLALKVATDGRTVPLHANRYTIGRSANTDIMLNDPSVSREHAALVRRAERFWVVDLGSLNGTFVNGKQTGEHPLSAGDRLTFGDVQVEILGG